MTITTQEAVKKIQGTGGKVFGVTFIKRTNGELRNGAYRLGVSKGVNGAGLKFDPAKKNLIQVFDMNNGHRFISIEGLQTITVGGQRFTVAGQ